MNESKKIKVKVFKDRVIINLHPYIPYQNTINALPILSNNKSTDIVKPTYIS